MRAARKFLHIKTLCYYQYQLHLQRHSHFLTKLASATSAVLYAVVSSSSTVEDVPKDAQGLSHHRKNGVGFLNPWESYREMSGLQILRAMIWYVQAIN